MMTRPGAWLRNDNIVDEQWGIWAGVLKPRNERLEDSDYVVIGPVVCNLPDQESSGILDWLWLEEAVLKISHSITEIIGE